MAARKKQRKKTLFIANTAMLSAVAVALSIAESLIPQLSVLPPGAKLGLSNISVMLGGDIMGFSSALFIALLKSVFAGITRGFTAFLMSFSGGILSTVVMMILLRFAGKRVGYLGIGICGAITHNLAQLTVSSVLTTEAVFVYLPALMVMSVFTGALTGTLLGLILPHYRRLYNGKDNYSD